MDVFLNIFRQNLQLSGKHRRRLRSGRRLDASHVRGDDAVEPERNPVHPQGQRAAGHDPRLHAQLSGPRPDGRQKRGPHFTPREQDAGDQRMRESDHKGQEIPLRRSGLSRQRFAEGLSDF